METCFIPFLWIFQKQDSPDRWIKLIGSFFLDINWWTGSCPGSGEIYLPNTEAQAAEVAAEAAAEGDTEAPKYGALQSSLGDSALKSSIYNQPVAISQSMVIIIPFEDDPLDVSKWGVSSGKFEGFHGGMFF